MAKNYLNMTAKVTDFEHVEVKNIISMDALEASLKEEQKVLDNKAQAAAKRAARKSQSDEVYNKNTIYKGRLTVVFPPQENKAIYGKILPIWGNPKNRGDQIFFNGYSLKKNTKFPEQSGCCLINYEDPTIWDKHEDKYWDKGEEKVRISYTPRIKEGIREGEIIVFFKLMMLPKADGNKQMVAVAIFASNKLDEETKAAASRRKRCPKISEITGVPEEDDGTLLEQESKLQNNSSIYECGYKATEQNFAKEEKFNDEEEVEEDACDDIDYDAEEEEYGRYYDNSGKGYKKSREEK